MGKKWEQWQMPGSKFTEDGACSHEIKRCLLLERKVMTNLDSILKSRDTSLPTKVHLAKTMDFPVVMYGYERWTIKEGWVLKNWCFWTVVLEKTLESSLDCKEIQSVHPKGNQSSIFIGRTDAEAETPILWPPDVKSWHVKRPWCWERLKVGGEGDDRGWDGWMASPTHWTWVKQASRVGDGQWGLACCDSWGRKESVTTEPLNWTELNWTEPSQSVDFA